MFIDSLQAYKWLHRSPRAGLGVLYLGLNILGTVYYARLRKRGENTPALVTLIVGWMGPSLLSLYPVSLEMKAAGGA